MKKAAETIWKKGRGKLGPLDPLLGSWQAEADTPMGRVRCSRTFSKFHGKGWIILDADWDFGGQSYREHAIFGDEGGTLTFWSFTSDGKHSTGHLVAADDIHPEAIAFEAQMPAGTARMVYWPGPDESVNWAVESKTKKGWNRFTLHVYHKV